MVGSGAVHLTDDLHVVDWLTGGTTGVLHVHPRHRIDRSNIAYHREYWTRR